MTAAGRMQMIMELLGGQPVRDECGCIIYGRDGKPELTPQIICPEDARKLLGFETGMEIKPE